MTDQTTDRRGRKSTRSDKWTKFWRIIWTLINGFVVLVAAATIIFGWLGNLGQ